MGVSRAFGRAATTSRMPTPLPERRDFVELLRLILNKRPCGATRIRIAMATNLPMAARPTPTPPGNEPDLRLSDVPLEEVVELVRIDLPQDELEPLLERGVLPGCRLCPVRRSPFGDPVVLVDGSLLALRRELAGCLCVRRAAGRSH